jgi:hypothetical protein
MILYCFQVLYLISDNTALASRMNFVLAQNCKTAREKFLCSRFLSVLSPITQTQHAMKFLFSALLAAASAGLTFPNITQNYGYINANRYHRAAFNFIN